MEIKSQFWFSNPLIHTVRFDEILPSYPEDHYVNLRIKSEENSPCFCSLVSVQKAQCPYFDTIADAKRFRRWQTMDESTSMLIDVDNLTDGKKELLIVLIGAEDELCNFVNKEARRERCEGKKAVDESLRKNVTMTLEATGKTGDRLKATFIVAIGYLGITIVCFIVSGYLVKFDLQDRNSRKMKPALEDEMRAEGEDKTLEDITSEDGQKRLEEAVRLADEGGEEKTKTERKVPDIENGETTLDTQVEEGLQRTE